MEEVEPQLSPAAIAHVNPTILEVNTPSLEDASPINSKPQSRDFTPSTRRPHITVKVIQFEQESSSPEKETDKVDFENSPMIKDFKIDPPKINV